MESILGHLNGLFQAALVRILGEQGRDLDPLIRPAGDPKFGDYQSNMAMSLAKRLKQKPRDVAGLQLAIETLASSKALRKRLGGAGCRRCRERFDHRRMVEQIEGLYERLMG